jgi:hypothetical protein
MAKLTFSIVPLFMGLLTIGQLQSSSAPHAVTFGHVVRAENCGPQGADELVVSGRDFRWNQPLDEIQRRARGLYEDGKRLRNRAFLDEDRGLLMPVSSFSGTQYSELTPKFILSVRRHIEEALRFRYVDAIMFSDMGHSHFFIPNDFYDRELAHLPVRDRDVFYTKVLAHEGLKMLYHTAEQLTMLDEDRQLLADRHIQWRFFTRNLVGDNKGLGKLEFVHQQDHSYNTARDYQPGYRYWGAGFYVTASKDGCFPFTHQGETYYFDLNLDGFDMSVSGNPI